MPAADPLSADANAIHVPIGKTNIASMTSATSHPEGTTILIANLDLNEDQILRQEQEVDIDSLLRDYGRKTLLANGENFICHRWRWQPRFQGPGFRTGPKYVVVKTPKQDRKFTDDTRLLRKFSLLHTPYFPELYAAVGDPSEPTIIMEYFDCRSLPEYLAPYIEDRARWDQPNTNLNVWRATQTTGMIPERVIWKIFSDLVQAAAIAATGYEDTSDISPDTNNWNTGIVHVDLNPTNCLVRSADENEPEMPRVVWSYLAHAIEINRGNPIDGGRGQKQGDAVEMYPNTTWMAPVRQNNTFRHEHNRITDLQELLPRYPHDDAEVRDIGSWTNIYLIGAIILWVIELCPLPTELTDGDHDAAKTLQMDKNILNRHKRYSARLRQLVKECLQNLPDDRPSLTTLQQEIARNYTRQRQPLKANETYSPLPILSPFFDLNTRKRVADARSALCARTGRRWMHGNMPSTSERINKRLLKWKQLYDRPCDGIAQELDPPPLPTPNGTVRYTVEDEYSSNTTTLKVKIWPKDRRTARECGKQGGKKISLEASLDATVYTLKDFVANWAIAQVDKYTSGVYIIILPKHNERPLDNTIPLSLLEGTPLDVLVIPKTCVKDYQDSDHEDCGGLQFFEPINNWSGAKHVPRELRLTIFVWQQPRTYTRKDVATATPISLWVQEPSLITIKQIRDSVKTLYGRHLNMVETSNIILKDGGPLQQIHLGSDYTLNDDTLLSNVVCSREADAYGNMIIRHLDGYIKHDSMSIDPQESGRVSCERLARTSNDSNDKDDNMSRSTVTIDLTDDIMDDLPLDTRL